jgi:hypothetical protein
VAIPDQTIPLTIQIPPEFVALCSVRGMTAPEVLRGFIADVCNLKNYVENPRADEYSSNGSDERMYAQQWFGRAYPG